MKLDNDFSDIMHESKLEKQKRMLIALFVVIAIIAAVSWAVFAYLGQSSHDNAATSTGTSVSTDDKETDEMGETSTTEDVPSVTEEKPATSSANNSTQSRANQSSGTLSPSNYDPSKCDPLKTQADNLKIASDQKKVTYDNAFAARKNYGYFYDQYGNSTDAQRAYDAQEAQLNSLQTDWQDALNKQNAAYSKYQECRASL